MGSCAAARPVLYRLVTLLRKKLFIVGKSFQDEKLKEDELVRETIKELQAVDRDKLDISELEDYLKLIYQIHGKLSFALTIFETLHE